MEQITDENTTTSIWERKGHFYLHMPKLCADRILKDGAQVRIVKIILEVMEE